MPASYQSTVDKTVWNESWPEVAGVEAPVTGLLSAADVQRLLDLETKFGVLPASSKVDASLTDESWVNNAYAQLNLPAPTGPIIESVMSQGPA
jgi:hypothetical protein